MTIVEVNDGMTFVERRTSSRLPPKYPPIAPAPTTIMRMCFGSNPIGNVEAAIVVDAPRLTTMVAGEGTPKR